MIFYTTSGPIKGKIKNIPSIESKLHRLDGPAIKYSGGYECWYKNGKKHRDNEPAEIYPHGSKLYYQNGLLHNPNGPTVIIVRDDILIANTLLRRFPSRFHYDMYYKDNVAIYYYYNNKVIFDVHNDEDYFKFLKRLVLS